MNGHDLDIRSRYARQIAVAEIGKEGQKKILSSRVFIVGCGALGSMVAMQLAGAGVGALGIADFDTVDISNIQRQFFFDTDDTGQPKVEILGKRINNLNPEVKVEIFKEFMTPVKGIEIFKNYDIIIDATDNPESKRMIGMLAYKLGKACCIGGVRDFSGQVMTLLPHDHRFEEYFGQGASEGVLPCSLGGVMGPTAALCASIQASETLKYIADVGELLSGRVLVFNLLDNTFKYFTL